MAKQKYVTEFTQTQIHELITILLKPLLNLLVRWRVDPNVFTWFSMFCAAVSGYHLAIGRWLDAGLWLLANGVCDVIDGALAREMPERSERLREKGAFLDPAVDRVNDGFLFIGLMCFGLLYYLRNPNAQSEWLVVFFAVLMAAAIAHPISSYYRARIESLRMRFQEKKPLTRAGFHVALTIVIIGMSILPRDGSWQFYLYGVTLLVSIPTIANMVRRFFRALMLFDQQKL